MVHPPTFPASAQDSRTVKPSKVFGAPADEEKPRHHSASPNTKIDAADGMSAQCH